MRHVGISNRKNHRRVSASNPAIAQFLQKHDLRLAGFVGFGRHTAVGGDDKPHAEVIELRELLIDIPIKSRSRGQFLVRVRAGRNRLSRDTSSRAAWLRIRSTPRRST
jgi:hypothetical protein